MGKVMGPGKVEEVKPGSPGRQFGRIVAVSLQSPKIQ